MFLPLRDNNPTIHFPVVTVGLIVVNVLVFIYELSLGPDVNAFIASYGTVPYEITHNTDLNGLSRGVSTVHQHGPPIIQLTLITSMFLHGGFLHIFGNMLFLWIFGNNIEDILGSWHFLFFYFACGLIAALTYIITQPQSTVPTVGASGAVAGVLGAYAVSFPRARVHTLVFIFLFIRVIELPAAFLLVFWFLIQSFSGLASLTGGGAHGGVAWFAHIGGFLAGALYMMFLFRRRRRIYNN